MDPYGQRQPINVPYRHDQPGGGGMPPGYPPYPPLPPQSVKTGMNTASWVVLGVVVMLVVVVGGWYAWGSYQQSRARNIPLYPGADLIPSSVYECASG